VNKGGEMGIKNEPQYSLLNLPIHKEICFTTDKDKYSEKIMKQQTKILEKFSLLLKRILEPGEEVFLAVKATSHMAPLEQITIGWVIVYIKRCILVFTNKRILHFPTRADFSPKPSVAQIRYGDLQFRHWISDFRPQTFLYKKLTLEAFSKLPEPSPIIPHMFRCLNTPILLSAIQTLDFRH